MNTEMKALIEKRSAAAVQMRTLVETAEKEDRGLSTEERSQWDAMDSDVTNIEARLGDLKKVSDLDKFDYAVSSENREAPKKETSRLEAFNAFTRSHPDTAPLTADVRQVMAEMRAQTVGTPASGGYLVPEEWASGIESAMKAFGGIRNVATIISSTSGDALHMPTDDDTSNVGAILGENTQDAEQDVTFSELVLNAYKYTSNIIRVPVELLQDSAFNVDGFLQRKFGERLGRATAAHYATGTGTAQPNGLFTAATSGKTAAANNAITYLELLDLKHSVDPAYRGNARWVMNDSTLAVLKKLVDLDGRPLWAPNIVDGSPGMLDGDLVVIDQGAPSIATITTPIAYGDMSKYIIRDVAGFTMTRLVERYADFYQVGFLAMLRTDGDLLDAGQGPVKKLTMAV